MISSNLETLDYKKATAKLENNDDKWSKFPDDILIHQVFNNLCWLDRIYARCVCKNWLQLLNEIPYQQPQCPWLFRYNYFQKRDGYFTNSLYDLNSQKEFIIKSKGLEGLNPRYGSDSRPLASKNGWILFSQTYTDNEDRGKSYFLFLHCPFSDKYIKLPDWWSFGNFIHRAIISSEPTSRDCLIFALVHNRDHSRVEISMCSIGDEKWKLFTFHVTLNPNSSRYFRARYVNNLLYLVFEQGSVGEFNVNLQEWRMLTNDDTGLPSGSHYRYVCNKEEFMVARTPSWCANISELRSFDGESKRWMKEESLGNRVLFMSQTSTYLVEAVGDTSKYANMVFPTPLNPNCYFYFNNRDLQYEDGPFADRVKNWDFMYNGYTWIMPPKSTFKSLVELF